MAVADLVYTIKHLHEQPVQANPVQAIPVQASPVQDNKAVVLAIKKPLFWKYAKKKKEKTPEEIEERERGRRIKLTTATINSLNLPASRDSVDADIREKVAIFEQNRWAQGYGQCELTRKEWLTLNGLNLSATRQQIDAELGFKDKPYEKVKDEDRIKKVELWKANPEWYIKPYALREKAFLDPATMEARRHISRPPGL